MIADLLSVVLAASEYFCGRLFLLIKKINKQISYTLNRKQESVQNVCAGRILLWISSGKAALCMLFSDV